jgi:RNA polymerase primary sigma factor
MTGGKETQAVFMESLNSLKEYAKVNGNVVTGDDVKSYFKGMELDDSKLQMIYGYLLASNIKIEDGQAVDGDFMSLFDTAAQDTEEELTTLEKIEKLKPIPDDNINYEEDEQYVKLYLKDCQALEQFSDTTRAYLLVNIVEDKDKESLKLFSESFLTKIVEWIEPYRKKGIPAGDLIQESNLAMMSYISSQQWLNNSEWRDAIKEGTTDDLIRVMNEIEAQVHEEVEDSIYMMFVEQSSSAEVSEKVLDKVNLVNDGAKRLHEELGRKPTVEELAKHMNIDEGEVAEAIRLSAEAIEDIK